MRVNKRIHTWCWHILDVIVRMYSPIAMPTPRPMFLSSALVKLIIVYLCFSHYVLFCLRSENAIPSRELEPLAEMYLR